MDAPLPPLTEDAVTAEVRRQQQIFLVRQVPVMSAVNLLSILLVTGLFLSQVEPAIVIGWALVTFSATTIQLIGWLRIRARPAPLHVSGRSLVQAGHWAALMGLLWGSAAPLFFGSSPAYQLFLTMVAAGMTAGTVSLLNPIPTVCLRFIVGAMAPLFVTLLATGTELTLIAAGLCIVFGGALYQGSLKAFAQFADLVRTSTQLQRAKADLTDAIASTHDGFAMFDADGRLVLANQRFRQWFPGVETADDAQLGSGLRQVAGGFWVQSTTQPTSRGGLVSVHTDVTALKDRERDLIAATQRAEEANRAKSEFLANMSHELRTPLNAIIGFADMMRREDLGPLGQPRYREYSSDIVDSASHLLAIINDILDVSRIETATYRITTETLGTQDLLESVARLCGQTAGAAGTRLTLSCDPDLAQIEADPRAMRQVLVNLVNNALKFTPAPGRVGLEARLTSEGLPQFTVWDEGIGIPADKLEWVRKPFHQVEGPFQRRYQGTGLGLAISDALVSLHGGRMDIASTEGVGTRVSLVLPAQPRAARTQAATG